MPRSKPKSDHAEPKQAQVTARPNLQQELANRHLRLGWLGLLVFLTLGIALEALHGFKIEFYLSADNETRRLMWTLAHAHGTLFSLIHIALAATLAVFVMKTDRYLKLASSLIIGAWALMPLGFFLGGIWLYSGDPGLGIVLAPVGAVMMMAGVFLVGRSI